MSEISLRVLGRAAGLERIGVSHAILPAGRESLIYHSHTAEEEWLYILSGRGAARIDGEDLEVSAGDFMGFPTPSVPHTLTNTGESDLVYLMGGESRSLEIAEFPDLGKLAIRDGRKGFIIDATVIEEVQRPQPEDEA
jgi:uncharacterized cupin superfamily protein